MDKREKVALAIAFAGRDRHDASKDEIDFWAHTCETGKARYLKMADAAIATLNADSSVLALMTEEQETLLDQDLHRAFEEGMREGAKEALENVSGLKAEIGITRTDKHADAECIGHLERENERLRVRVAKLEGALIRIADLTQHNIGMTAREETCVYNQALAAMGEEDLS